MADQSDNQKRPPARLRRQMTVSEWLAVLFFTIATWVMATDFVVMELGLVSDLGGGIPPWTALIATVGAMLAIWLALRRRIGGWAALLGYALALMALVSLGKGYVAERVDRIEISRYLSAEEQTQLEKAVGCRIRQRAFALLFLRDPERRARIEGWLKEHPSSPAE